LFVEYADSLQIDLCFQGFAQELQRLPQMYGAPGSCLLLARRGDEVAGCIGVRSHASGACEMKRLYVRESLRGSGTGRALALRAIDAARAQGYRRMLLDTLSTMQAARNLYQALGFRQIDAYYGNPIAGTSFMALDLQAT
jgi:putative acetyltransferase